MTDTLATYKNGNTQVTILSDGTKIREYEDGVVPYGEHPESIDIKLTDYCDMGCEFCFTPDMKVLTMNGLKDISSIKIGDKVYSYNLDTKKHELKDVQNTLAKNIDEKIFIFELENDQFIKCTSDHKLYTSNRGWQKAKDILETDELHHIV